MRQAQANSGFAPIELDVQRLYAMIYQWVVGDDVGVVYQNLQVDNELPNLVRNIYENDILGRGYSIVDTKPDHIIVRTEDGEIIRDRNGEIVYALIDFELLRRTREFEHIHKTKQRNKYWNLIFHGGKKAAIPDDRKYVNILGVDYVYGSASNGGRLWVVGKNPELFDYYEPVKWRRTPRSKLSLTTSRTTTQDSIQLVYKESRVKMIPSGEPDSEICLFGYNSPFEEVAIAQDLRRLGIPVVLPRAIYRTSHESYPTEFLEDSSRIESHQQMMIDEERILSDNHDYMLLYGLWRGIDPLQDFKEQGHWGMLDVEQAYGFGLITDTERIDIINDTRERLCNAGFSVPLRDDRFILYSEKDVLRRDQKNRYDVIISIDGNRAFRRKLLTKEQFTSEMNQLADQLKTHNYVPLNLRDSHVLFSMNPDGVLKKSNGTLEKVLCNFEQIRPHWFQASYNAIS